MKINYHAPINTTGYGIASLNILKELISSNIETTYFPIGNPSVLTQEDYDIISKLINNFSVFNKYSPCIKIWHQFDLTSRIGSGQYLAYPFFELDTFNNLEKQHLKIPDKLIASSEWAKQVFEQNGIRQPIDIVPLGVDNKIFDHTMPKTIQTNNYIFLTIGKWEVRKSHDLLPSIFNKAFPNEKDVELWILASEHTNSYSTKEEIEKWKNLYNHPNIKVIPGVGSHKEIAQVIQNSDCGLYISKAEGWNLELLETMAMNKPVIATNYSAHTEFCNPKNCYLVKIEELEKAYDGKAFVKQGNWAKIGSNQIDQTIEYMRYCYKNRINNNQDGLITAKQYSWRNSAESLVRCI
ncbi:MAG: glycosyltransferase family 1 protein [Caulobacteraceae bacterium]|nr:glycosyltransferase family 1 protein [Caulobacteraceae bacterium]